MIEKDVVATTKHGRMPAFAASINDAESPASRGKVATPADTLTPRPATPGNAAIPSWTRFATTTLAGRPIDAVSRPFELLDPPATTDLVVNFPTMTPELEAAIFATEATLAESPAQRFGVEVGATYK